MNDAALDPSGAGDALLAAASLSMAAGADIWGSALIGSMASAIQISRLGNIPITADELRAKF